eukprot:4372504-Ditylum_brightwellii.AAC.1
MHCTWLTRPPMNRTYANLKIHFNNKYQLQNTLNTTTCETGYHQMNHVSKTTSDNIEEAVQNFAEAFATDQEAFAMLTATNQDLSTHVQLLSAANQQMQAQFASIQQQMVYMAVNTNQQQQPRYNNKSKGKKEKKTTTTKILITTKTIPTKVTKTSTHIHKVTTQIQAHKI